jgi:phage protein U
MAQMKLPYPLYSGEGRFYGMYIVKEIEDDQDLILANGAPLKVSFQIRLIRVDGGLLSWLL